MINVDLESNYVRVTIKGKIFQISIRDEIKIEKSTSQRSMTTGHLLIVMPKVNYKAPLQMGNKTDVIREDGKPTFLMRNGYSRSIANLQYLDQPHEF